MRSKDVADGQQVEIPVLQYNRTVGTQRESTSGNGNLGYSAGRILTFLSLLIPAFSLLKSPQLLPVLLLPVKIAPLPIYNVYS